MATITRNSTQKINASPEKIWKILSEDFLEISKWADSVRSSVANPKTPNGFNDSPHGGRVCEVDGFGTTDERVSIYDKKNMNIAYTLTSTKMPFFVNIMGADWIVVKVSDGKSSVTFKVSAETKGIVGTIMKLPLGRMLSRSAPGLLGDLKKYSEK